MIDLNNISHIYFVGIGGIGMSAIARYFHQQGKQVAGYDKSETALTRKLEAEGISVVYNDNTSDIAEWAKVANNNLLVIYTPAIPHNSEILNYFKQGDFNFIKRSDALALITANAFTIAIAGTHGKTTTATYLAHFLKQENVNLKAFLGGISSNYQTNFVDNKIESKEIVVVEADEFDRSFLKLKPNVSIITSCEADHLDIYGDYETLSQAYNDFANCTSNGGKLFLHESLKGKFTLRDDLEVAYYGFENADIIPCEIQVVDGNFQFKLSGKLLTNGLAGRHNVLNATAAISAAKCVSSLNKLESSIANFTGIKRRFEKINESAQYVYIDDYAHHPTEIKMAIAAAKELYPSKKLTVIFQPHLFSRTKDFANDFKLELSQADKVILLPIYPARELPIEGITSELLKGSTTLGIFNHEQTLLKIEEEKPELLLTLGAGNIDLLIEPLKTFFNQLNTSHV